MVLHLRRRAAHPAGLQRLGRHGRAVRRARPERLTPDHRRHDLSAWSQADLADRCQVARQAINAIETERYDPGLPLAFTISDVFGLAIEDIFLREPADPA
ncbi:hypothetical protein Cme02nite_48630 [Catellatospora methionotrophica]|uniref:HTH cro/C1-type domain-containing protein n=1 Tax=Catellatospora methionotrophica TaxID=121620 RepID=A0A8J3PG94_9ACTN|nr:helix-turn-helix transcriptional regulator [Catellatospora methionotrophica]GIG16531.1 hypothetical protein Cme02nite_48630 [Catellatospora methionotrophica]